MEKISRLINSALWDIDLSTLPRWRASLLHALRIAHNVIGDLADGQLTLRAMSLVYTTLLSIVPLLALSFSVLKGFDVHNEIQPLLLNFVSPLGEKGGEIVAQIIGFVENTKAGVLGTLGLAFLVYTAISLVQKIEQAFNHIWRVRRHRPLSERFSDYLSVIMIGPILIVSAIGLTASVQSNTIVEALSSIEPIGSIFTVIGILLPYILIMIAFTFIYIFVPNTKVKFRSALIGGLIAAILWVTIGWGFANFVAGSEKYTAIYSTFATLILFMFWLYVAWLILLIGSSIVFYHQHPEALTRDSVPTKLSNRHREQLGIAVMQLIAERFYKNESPLSESGLIDKLGIPSYNLERVTDSLVAAGLLILSEEEQYLPAKPFDTTPLVEVLRAIRENRNHVPTTTENHHFARSEKLSAQIESHLDQALEGKMIKSLIE
ncbi:MAG: ribonuclease BN [Gammaproteobacteria bacterium]|nr:YihY/virulence factor BrkB family protein [Gammaproteobacteria bacterium]PCH62374.1 MAG: ribonuclease BN [Gammaproteobacteria bacterium]